MSHFDEKQRKVSITLSLSMDAIEKIHKFSVKRKSVNRSISAEILIKMGWIHTNHCAEYQAGVEKDLKFYQEQLSARSTGKQASSQKRDSRGRFTR